MKYSGAILALVIFIATLPSCTKDHAVQSNCQSCSDTVSFKNSIIPIFAAKCSLAGCHTGAFPSGSVNLDSSVAYAQVLATGKGYVNPGNPVTSILVDQLYAGVNPSTHMPQGSQLGDCDIQKIYCWIQQGAVNN